MAQNHTRKDDNLVNLDLRMVTTKGNETTPASLIPGRGVQSRDPALSVPANLALTAGNNQISVAFDAVTGAGSYGVQYRVNGTTTVTYAAAASSPKVLALADQTAYNVRVRAEANDGMTFSDWSDWASATTT